MTQWQGHPNTRRPLEADEIYDDVWPPPMPRSVRHYTPLAQPEPQPQPVLVVDRRRGRAPQQPRAASPIPPRSSTSRQQQGSPQRQVAGLPQPRVRLTQDDPQYQPIATHEDRAYHDDEPVATYVPRVARTAPRRGHWLLSVGLGMCAMLILWQLALLLVSWWQVSQDDLHYGRPRTFQCDAVVGHNDSAAHPSHFIALNLNRQVEIIEFPGGDVTKARVYLGPPLVGAGQDLVPVTLSFRDVNGDGKPDMLVDIQGSLVVFLNDGQQFRPLRAGERVHL